MKRWTGVHVGAGLALLCAALFGLLGCDLEDVLENANVEAVREVTETFSVTGLTQLNVDSSNGFILVEAADTSTVTATARLRSRGETLEKAEERVDAIVYEMSQEGDIVTLRYRSSDQTDAVRRYSGVSFTVTVPRQSDIDAETSNGDIVVSGAQGAFDLDTSNGDIELSDLIGTVTADTSNGRIEADRVNGALTLETSNGAIRLENVEARVDARTSNGRIEFSGVLVGDSHRMRTSNGTIVVEVPASASMAFDASTSIGRISADLPLTGDTEGREWNATLNPPALTTLELRTSNGSIHIEPLGAASGGR